MPTLRAVPEPSRGPHPLHGPDRPWPATNCYIDLWIELLHALGRDPLPLLGLAVALDWEADHFTFLKPAAGDLFEAAGITLHELALWDDTAAQLAAQLAAGAVPLLEVDAFFLPDTGADAYRRAHTKTTIGVAALDPDRRWLEYFHNGGRFELEGDDYAGALGCAPHRAPLFPYAELARIAAPPPPPDAARAHARAWLRRNARTRAPGNPVARFAAALPGLLDRVGSDPARVNALCFNTTRQLGGAFGLLADHLAWLGDEHVAAQADAAWLADAAKILQFQLARAARRGRADPAVAAALAEIASVWDRSLAVLAA